MHIKREEKLFKMLNESHELIKNMNSQNNINLIDIFNTKKKLYESCYNYVNENQHKIKFFKTKIDKLMKTYILKYDKIDYFKILSYFNIIFMKNDIKKKYIKTYDDYLKYIKTNEKFEFKFGKFNSIDRYLKIAIKFKSYIIIKHILKYLKYCNIIKDILKIAIDQDDKYVIHLIYKYNLLMFINQECDIYDLINHSIDYYKYDIVEILLSYPYHKNDKIKIKNIINKIKSKYIKYKLLLILNHDNIVKY